jgi:hypothetical protein
VRFYVNFGRFARTVFGMRVMAVRSVSVVRGGFVIAGLMVLCSFPVVTRRVLMVRSGVMAMIYCFLEHFTYAPFGMRTTCCAEDSEKDKRSVIDASLQADELTLKPLSYELRHRRLCACIPSE